MGCFQDVCLVVHEVVWVHEVACFRVIPDCAPDFDLGFGCDLDSGLDSDRVVGVYPDLAPGCALCFDCGRGLDCGRCGLCYARVPDCVPGFEDVRSRARVCVFSFSSFYVFFRRGVRFRRLHRRTRLLLPLRSMRKLRR